MKKLKRNPEIFDIFEVFSNVIEEKGHNFNDPLVLEDFITTMRQSLIQSKEKKTMVFGKRTEFLFAYVACALGEVVFLKQEDAGDVYFAGKEKLSPDYRIILKDSQQFLVEVKNCHDQNKFSIKKATYIKLKRYADLNNLELKLAVYFSFYGIWVLLSIDHFDETHNSYKINLARAVACSEMSVLGDCMIGTTPDLELHFLSKTGREISIEKIEHHHPNTLEMKVYCAGNEITDKAEKKIAIHLIRFGDWVEQSVGKIIERNRAIGIKFIFSPKDQEDSNFSMIGSLSGMITKGFFEHTVSNGEIISLKPRCGPNIFQVFIPTNYESSNLPLWRIYIQSNPSFKPS